MAKSKIKISEIELVSAYTYAERRKVSATAVYNKINSGEFETVPVGKFNLIDWNRYQNADFPKAEEQRAKRKAKPVTNE